MNESGTYTLKPFVEWEIVELKDNLLPLHYIWVPHFSRKLLRLAASKRLSFEDVVANLRDAAGINLDNPELTDDNREQIINLFFEKVEDENTSIEKPAEKGTIPKYVFKVDPMQFIDHEAARVSYPFLGSKECTNAPLFYSPVTDYPNDLPWEPIHSNVADFCVTREAYKKYLLDKLEDKRKRQVVVDTQWIDD